MARIAALGLTLVLITSPALPARANWDAKMDVQCTELDDSKPDKPKLTRAKAANDEIVRACLAHESLDTGDANVDAHALVFDSDTFPHGELRVVRRCDAQVVCTLSVLGSSSAAVKDTPKKSQSKSVVLFELIDVGTGNDGSMICKQADSYTPGSGKFSFKNSCAGILDWNGTPCAIKLRTGKLFETSGTCP